MSCSSMLDASAGLMLLHDEIQWLGVQVAALEVAASHPEGIDYLVINAGTNDNHVQPTLDLCVVCSRP